jgi:oligosaccharide reducing-end xylanase
VRRPSGRRRLRRTLGPGKRLHPIIGGLDLRNTIAVACLSTVVVASSFSQAVETGAYPNLFALMLGKSEAETKAKIDEAWGKLFYGDDATERVYFPVGEDMAYIADIGGRDVRTEGMSYGMMIAVQLDKKAEFDRIWRWAKTYMFQEPGSSYAGYFAWHCTTAGRKLDGNPASDGEEYFATALFFASSRWGDGEGIFNYRKEAQAILDVMLHKAEDRSLAATSMFDAQAKQVVFVPTKGPASQITDPSYHLPHFYELWARWADKDNAFWKDAAVASRDFFKKAAHPRTGLMPDYAEFGGAPADMNGGQHNDFRFDAWRVGMNVALDYLWCKADPWEVEQSDRLLSFFRSQGMSSYGDRFSIDGKVLGSDHSLGLVAMNAVACLAATGEGRRDFVQALWDASVPTGQWRYYNGMLYALALLNVGGSYKAYLPR